MGPLRSLLYIPGNRPTMLEKARPLPTDVLVPDLEDSVPPAEKGAARALVKSLLPGTNPCRVSAPNITAALAEPGIPKANSGISEPPTMELFAHSDAITPSGMPVPNFSGCLEAFLA